MFPANSSTTLRKLSLGIYLLAPLSLLSLASDCQYKQSLILVFFIPARENINRNSEMSQEFCRVINVDVLPTRLLLNQFLPMDVSIDPISTKYAYAFYLYPQTHLFYPSSTMFFGSQFFLLIHMLMPTYFFIFRCFSPFFIFPSHFVLSSPLARYTFLIPSFLM